MSPLFDNQENDLPLPGRRPAEESDRSRTMNDEPQPEREVTLNTGVVLALFFALALLCAVFFGFGYSIGRKSVPPAPVAESDTSPPPDDAANSTPKPVPGTVAVPSYVGPASTTASDAKPTAAKPTSVTMAVPATSAEAGTHPPVTRSPSAEISSAPMAGAAPTPVTSFATVNATGAAPAVYVQVSAVSHKEDANVLLRALRGRGYTVFTRTDPNDS